MVFRLTLGYRGTRYFGWQRQPDAVTVQQTLEEALGAVAGREMRVVGAGRTDAGVHARGQVAHIASETALPARALLHGTNHHLPGDIRVLAVDRMPADFHARRSAVSKEYRYRMVATQVLHPLDAPYAVRVRRDLDVGALVKAAAALVGDHDFEAFTLAGGAQTTTERTIYEAEWRVDSPRHTFRVVGEGFLRGMVRGLAGTLLEVGRGERTQRAWQELLRGQPRSAAGPTAPAHGLTLERVHYDVEPLS